jgi:hypothetical protein
VIPSLREIEIGFIVTFIAGELFANRVIGVAYTRCSLSSRDLFSKKMVIVAGDNCTNAVGIYTR